MILFKKSNIYIKRKLKIIGIFQLIIGKPDLNDSIFCPWRNFWGQDRVYI